MGGIFGVASKNDCIFDLFFGTDYHSHLGTRYGGMAVYGKNGFDKAIHNIENSPFRTKFEHDFHDLSGHYGIGCISDTEPQPLVIHSHLGTFSITTVGRVVNEKQLVKQLFGNNAMFTALTHGQINQTELVAALINCQSSIPEGIAYAQSVIEGSMQILALTPEGIYAARDRMGRVPLIVGKKEGAYCVSFEDFAYHNIGYSEVRGLGPGEIVLMTPDGIETIAKPGEKMRICAFLWVYYGYPTSSYEGVNVELMRYRSGEMLARRDEPIADIVAGVPDSGTAHAIGYANHSRVPFARPFIKYTPTWPRSFMPTHQSNRELIARMKLIPVESLLRDKRLVLVEDSIVRGTQMRETTEFLYSSGAREVHIRVACPPILYGCKYVNFCRSVSDLELIARRHIFNAEGAGYGDKIDEYIDPHSDKHQCMVESIRKELNFSSLKYQRLEDVQKAIGIDPCKLCTYCWNGRE